MTLSHKVAIRVPSTVNTNERISKKVHLQRVQSVATTLAQLYGGYEISEVSGGWLSPDTGLITETIKLVYAFAENIDQAQVLEQASKWCKEWAQEAIAVEIDGALHLVEA